MCAEVFATGHKDYDRLMQLSTEDLLKAGNDYIYQREMPDSALICYTIAQNRTSQASNLSQKRQAVQTYIGLWYLYFFHFFDHSKAFDNIEHAREVLESMGDDGQDMQPVLLLNYGCMYETLAEQSREDSLNYRAMEYFRQSYQAARQSGNDNVLSMAFSNMVYVSHTLNQLQDVEPEYHDFCQTTEGSDIQTQVYDKQMYQGLSLLHEGRCQEALELFIHQLEGEDPADKGLLRYQVMRHNNIALCHAASGNYQEAMQALKESEALASREGLLDAQLEVYRFMTEYAELAGESHIRDLYHSQYLSLKDTLLNYHQLQTISQLQFIHDLKEIDQRMQQMQQQSRRQTQLFFMVITVALIILFFLMWMFRQNRILRAANRQLYAKSLSLLENSDKERRRRHAAQTEAPAGRLVAEVSSADQIILQKITDVMESNPEIFDPDFSLERLSKIIDEKYRTVSRIINDTGAENSSQFINRYRIDEACRRINDTEHYGQLSLEAIANSVGFRSRSSFGTAFKRITGLTPSEYQKMAKQH